MRKLDKLVDVWLIDACQRDRVPTDTRLGISCEGCQGLQSLDEHLTQKSDTVEIGGIERILNLRSSCEDEIVEVCVPAVWDVVRIEGGVRRPIATCHRPPGEPSSSLNNCEQDCGKS